jgi:hypothetical protein
MRASQRRFAAISMFMNSSVYRQAPKLVKSEMLAKFIKGFRGAGKALGLDRGNRWSALVCVRCPCAGGCGGRKELGSWVGPRSGNNLKASADTRSYARSIKYVLKFLFRDLQAPLAIGAILWVCNGLRSSRPRFLPIAIVLATWFVYIVWTGGDVFECSRYFVPIMPLVIVAAISQLRQYIVKRRLELTHLAA